MFCLTIITTFLSYVPAGWTGGTITLVLSFIISLWNLRQLCSMHEINGKRMNRYHELGQYAFGEHHPVLMLKTVSGVADTICYA